MKKALIIIGLGLVGLVAIVLILATFQPDTFRIERTVMVNATADKPYTLIEDFRLWQAWSPWEKLDPNMARTFTGAERGLGAAYAWQGNDDVGSGRMEIVDTTRNVRILIDLEFTDPFEAKNTTEFTFTPSGDSTRVTWAMHGPNLFAGKVIGLFFNMDRMIGKDFETGLANLKAAVE